MNKLVIGTRGSELAVWQANAIAGLIVGVCDLPIEIRLVKTAGDRFADVPLSAIPSKGFFTKELEDELVAGRIDLAVHSLKDLPTVVPQGLAIGAVCCREDPRDALIALPEALDETQALGLRSDATVGTSSARRSCQLLSFMPSAHIKELRGNVPTRIRKLRERAFDAVVVACAGIRRLGINLSGLNMRILSENEMLPAPAQGILAVEIRDDDDIVRGVVSHLDEAVVRVQAALERGLLARLGGGCSTPFGALATVNNGRLGLRAALGVPANGAWTIRRVEVEGSTPGDVIEAAYKGLTAQQ